MTPLAWTYVASRARYVADGAAGQWEISVHDGSGDVRWELQLNDLHHSHHSGPDVAKRTAAKADAEAHARAKAAA